jgi:hypothetical protein
VTERAPTPTHITTEPEQSWDTEAVANTLKTEPRTIQDDSYGPGQLLSLGEDPTLHLEVYPTTHTVRITTPAARIELFQQHQPTITDTGVIFINEQAQHQLTLSAQGELTLTRTPVRTPLEQPIAAVLETDGSNRLPTGERGLAADSTPSEGPPETPAPSSQQRQEQEEQKRMTLTGRVGTPRYRKTPKDLLIASFPLAVHEGEKTTWHNIVAFGPRAEKLQGNLARGHKIEVIGYVHERQTKTRQGKPKTVKEIYAAVVKKVP